MATHLVVVVALVRGAPRDALPEILDDPCSRGNGPDGERAHALNGGTSHFEWERIVGIEVVWRHAFVGTVSDRKELRNPAGGPPFD